MSRVELRSTGDPGKADDLALGLSHDAKLLWLDAASQKAGYAPSAGSPQDPAQIWSLDGVDASAKIGGFALRLLDFDGKALATIPVEGDRLVAGRATLAAGFALTLIP